MSQSIPTFNTSAIWTSTVGSNTFCAVEVQPGPYQTVTQQVPFNGLNGAKVLFHGWPNRTWSASGYIELDSQALVNARLAAIQGVIDTCAQVEDTWYPMVDSNGVTFAECKILNNHKVKSHATASGWMVQVIANGIMKGMPFDDGT